MALHVVFAPSAAPDLRKALASVGREETVVACFEVWNEGPLDPEGRRDWTAQRYDDPEFVSDAEAFWASTLAASDVTLWTSARVATERTGFLEWISRRRDDDFKVADPSGRPDEVSPSILALLKPEEIVGRGLLDIATRPTPGALAALRNEWSRLTAENAPLRIIRDGRLLSAAAHHFDEALLDNADRTWLPAARIVGEVLGAAFDDWTFNVGDIFLCERLERLIETGALSARPRIGAKADLPHPWRLEVRRA
ncbi:MAG: DUF3658 domain-containing protein [Caulobacter sp.]